MLRYSCTTDRPQWTRMPRVQFCALLIMTLSTGCAGMFPQRPLSMSPVTPVVPQSEILTNPTQVSPRTNQNSGKPVLQGIEEIDDALPMKRDAAPDSTKTDPSQVDKSPFPTYREPESDYLQPLKSEPEDKTDAPAWKPLQAPTETDSVTGDPTEVNLGQPTQFPDQSNVPTVVESVPVQHIQPVSQAGKLWETTLKSTGDRPLEMFAVGNGPHRILILGSIYGNEPVSIELVDQFATLLKQAKLPSEYSILLIRTPNPDGLDEAMRTNRNGVDLNRNFPSTLFTANPNRQTGPHPASEIETQHLLRILKEYKPTRVIHVHDGIGHRPLVMLNKKWNNSIELTKLVKNIDAGEYDGAFKVGSIEEFASIRMSAEIATIQVPPKGFQPLSANELMQIALQGVSIENVLPKQAPLASGETIPALSKANHPPDGAKGYVEFLPPPPGTEKINQASSTKEVDDPRYYELPPPLEN